MLVSLSKFRIYFLWDKTIPFVLRATLISRKYINYPISFILNYFLNFAFSCAISPSSFSIMIISSTYTISIVMWPSYCRENIMWSTLILLVVHAYQSLSEPMKPCMRLLQPIDYIPYLLSGWCQTLMGPLYTPIPINHHGERYSSHQVGIVVIHHLPP
jgi:hypothetical protein